MLNHAGPILKSLSSLYHAILRNDYDLLFTSQSQHYW